MRPNQIKQQQKLQINFSSLTIIKVLGTDIWNPNFNVSLGKPSDLFWTSLSQVCE